jgi:8-oxo-dGTP diphosphatase
MSEAHTRTTDYVCGLAFDVGRRAVLLIAKQRPKWQAGKLNGIGGHIEAGETPLAAMDREMAEEAGLLGLPWEPLAVLRGANFCVHFFQAFSDRIWDAHPLTDEKVQVFLLHGLPGLPVIPNLRVLIPLALDRSGIVKPVELRDSIPEAA